MLVLVGYRWFVYCGGVLVVVVCVLRCGFPVSWVGSVPLMVWFSGFLDFDAWFTVALLLRCGWLVC